MQAYPGSYYYLFWGVAQAGSRHCTVHVTHTVHMTWEHVPYSFCGSGQVTLDKQRPMLRTVVNKTDQIDSVFRFFKMEVLAGEEDLIATVKENGCTFMFDFSLVYWNSRLGEEHWRVVEMMKKGDVVMDVFAGVGPFAVLAAKNKACVVYANDLNPHSYKYLVHNARSNLVSQQVKAYNLDARDFIASVTKQLLEKALCSSPPIQGEGPAGILGDVSRGCSPAMEVCSHVIMNLPASSVEFLDVFCGLFCAVPEELRSTFRLPLVHCYCFVKTELEEEREACALQQVTSHLGSGQFRDKDCNVEVVRSVSPNKVMVRVSFRLPPLVAYGTRDGNSEKEGGAHCTSRELEDGEDERGGAHCPGDDGGGAHICRLEHCE
jgi:tRNA (guanine37-N1)-methyltransferase